MKTICKLILIVLCLLTLNSFAIIDDKCPECNKLPKLELKTLRANIIGKEYTYDLSGVKDCSKTKIKYLGIVHTNRGKTYKVLTSFFVFKTSIDMCHGTSNIKIYDMKNRYVGQYYVGDPESLPDCLRKNKLLYLEDSKHCYLRKTRIINLNRGLPKEFFIPCTEDKGHKWGDVYTFSSEK